ncbi:MAG: ParA family protein [Kofleriaceae bacterium]|nr:ParA family protein [Myxococcales bacterium]MCB9559837.1 ParA family protein [Kofleriaceae bacterium]MCB9571448.1 ParA family protein [Kofleriaceae bacterium]
MEKLCTACGQSFRPAFVYQVAVTGDGRRNYFCSLECRKSGLGDEAFRARRARRIAILNQKGGTGKTTTAVNLAAGVAERGHNVLLIDTDAQGNVGVSLGVNGEQSLYHVLVEGVDPTDVAVPVRSSLDVITSDATLAAAEIWLARQNPDNRSRIMTKRLNLMQVSRRYDYVFVDCGPSLNLLNQNALSYADEVVIPVTCDYLALVGVKQVLRTIKDIERHLHHAVRISAVLPTFYDGRTRLAREVLETLQSHFKTKCLEPIRLNTRLAEAPSHRKSIFEYAPQSNGAADYNRVVDWVVASSAVKEAPTPTMSAAEAVTTTQPEAPAPRAQAL